MSCWEYYNVLALPGGNKDEEGAVWNRVGVALLAPLWLRALGHTIYDTVVGSMFSGKVRSFDHSYVKFDFQMFRLFLLFHIPTHSHQHPVCGNWESTK